MATLYVDLWDRPVAVDEAKRAELAELHSAQCWAVTPAGTAVLAYVDGIPVPTAATKARTWACTQHAHHRGGHHACDGHGTVLVTWPRRKPEHRWVPDRYTVPATGPA